MRYESKAYNMNSDRYKALTRRIPARCLLETACPVCMCRRNKKKALCTNRGFLQFARLESAPVIWRRKQMRHEKFHYASVAELRAALDALGVSLPLARSAAALARPLTVHGRTLANRIVVQPMEGADANADGTPGELTFRRYTRFAQSGAALIWAEAAAVSESGRSSPRQLILNEQTLPAFQRLVQQMREAAREAGSPDPVLILQITHSGRYAKPDGKPAPVIMWHKPLFEAKAPIDDRRIISDGELLRLAPALGGMAALAQRAGFDGVDLKCCHGYLLNESLSAFERPGPYGGSLDNRTRLLLSSMGACRAETSSDFIVTARLGVYDGFPYPHGFGADEACNPVLDDALAIAKTMHDRFDVRLLNVTAGNPYVNPHVNRPYDMGNYLPDEHPLAGVGRITGFAAAMQKALPDTAIVASGLSYLRQYAPLAAAGLIEAGQSALVGFGRLAFADADFARHMLQSSELDAKKVCVTGGQCARLLRAGIPTGCVVRDRDVYRRVEEIAEKAVRA